MAVYSSNPTKVTLSVHLGGPESDEEEAEELVLSLIEQLREENGALGEVRRRHEEAPSGSKGLGAAILGAFYSILNPDKLRAFLSFLRERLGGRAANLEVIANGRSMRLSLGSASDLNAAVSECIRFVEETRARDEAAPEATPPTLTDALGSSTGPAPAQLSQPLSTAAQALPSSPSKGSSGS